jgi:hypothetical protein
MPSIVIALFAACGLLAGFGTHLILSFFQTSRRVSIIIAIVLAVLIFGGALAGFSHSTGGSLFAANAQVRLR